MDSNNHLKSTFVLSNKNGFCVPIQNNIIYPSFEMQKRPAFFLHQIWKKVRFSGESSFSMSERNGSWIEQVKKHPIFTDRSTLQLEDHLVPGVENKGTGEESTVGMETYEDGVFYVAQFTLPDEFHNKVIYLKSMGISYVCDIFINDEYVGVHEGGFTSFAFDITSFVRKGLNEIIIRVDNPAWGTRVDTIPATGGTDFFNYTGIIQDLFIEANELVFMTRVEIVPLNIEGDLKCRVFLNNRTKETFEGTFDVTIFEMNQNHDLFLQSPYPADVLGEVAKTLKQQGTVVIPPSDYQVVEWNIHIDNPKCWDIRQPNLYAAKIELYKNQEIVDTFVSEFGIRTIKTHQTQILLNEKPVFLAGISRHEEWPIYGRTATIDRIREDLLHIERLHVNYVRTVHYPNHPFTYLMLDRMGLCSAVEIPLWQFTKEHYEANEIKGLSFQMFREMVYSLYNHPSILMWSTQNESVEVPLRKVYNKKLSEELKTLIQDQRLLTQSAAADQPGYFDPSMEYLDVLGWTMYFGIFHGSTPYEGTRNFLERAHEMWPNKPIINTEYGVWSFPDDSQMDYQLGVYLDAQQALLEKATVTPQGEVNPNGYVASMNYWTIFNWYVNHNKFHQTMGLYHMDRKTPKKITEVFIKDHHFFMGPAQMKGVKSLKKNHTITNNPFHMDSERAVLIKVDAKVNYLYLAIEVFDAHSEVGLQLVFNPRDESLAYSSKKIQIAKKFTIFVPMYRLPLKFLKEFEMSSDNRHIRILSIYLTNDASNQ